MWVSLGFCLLVAAAATVVAFPQEFSNLNEEQQTETDPIVVDAVAQNFSIDGNFWWLQGSESTTEKPACPQGYDCVAEFQCVNGLVTTDGEGSLNLRLGPSRLSATSCSVSKGNNVCCRLPGGHEVATSGEGTVSTGIGEGVQVTSESSDAPASGQQQETPASRGPAPGSVSDEGFSQIPGSGGVVGPKNVGIAEGSPREEPSVLPISEQCDVNSDCVPVFLCHNGEINADGGSLVDIRLKPASSKACVNPEYPEVQAVCCRIPGSTTSDTTPPAVTPAPLTACSENLVCVYDNQCNADGTANTDGSGSIDVRLRPARRACFLAGTSEVGVCCLPPPPPVLDTCPGSAACIRPGGCLGNAIDANYELVPYTPDFIPWAQCSLSETPDELGICCENPAPPTPQPLKTCPDQLECVLQGQCGPDGSVIIDGTGLIDLRQQFYACSLEDSDVLGVCCRQDKASVPVVDVCPGSTVCIPDILCIGDALDENLQFVPYDLTYGRWAQCSQFGGLGSPGICCENPLLTTTPPPTSYPVATTCGIRNEAPSLLDTRITNPNAEAKFGEFPWQAILFYSNYTFKCGATVIGEKWLLTAAHCVMGLSPADIRIRLGEWQVNTFDEPLAYVDATVKVIHVHPRFNPRNVHNDVAVLEVVPFGGYSYHINAACLPKSTDISAERFAGKRCFATGWGKDAFEGYYQRILKKIDLPVVDHERCQFLLRKTRLSKYFVLDKSFMCAGGEENKDACTGDGGGPLVCEDDDGIYRLVGITAWGIGCGTKDVPGVYADVAALSDFINGVIGVQDAPPLTADRPL